MVEFKLSKELPNKQCDRLWLFANFPLFNSETFILFIYLFYKFIYILFTYFWLC